MEEKRNLWMDMLKIVSAYAIVFIHISGSRFYGTYGSDGFFRGLVINAATRFAVPCFLLITGALTMNKERYSLSMAFQRAKKYLFLLFGATFVYLFIKCILWQGCEGNFLSMYVKALAANQTSGHLWYLYQMVWLWLILPYVQLLYSKTSIKQRITFVAVTVFIPGMADFAGRMLLEHPLDLTPACSITIQAGYIGMLVLGGILYDGVKKYSSWKVGVIGVFACACSFTFLCLATIKLCALRGFASDELFLELRLPAFLYGCSVFIFFSSWDKILTWKLKERWKHIVARTADALLFVYVWHCLLQWIWKIENNSIRNLIAIAAIQYMICIFLSCIGKKLLKIVRTMEMFRKILHPALGVLIFFVVFCMFCHTDSPWSKVLPWVDSDVFLYGGWAMCQGDIMYVDFFDHKGPYLYFLQWIGWNLTESIFGMWYVELVFVCIAVAAAYGMTKSIGIKDWTSAGIVMAGYWYLANYLSLGNYTETYVMPCICVSAYIFTAYFADKKYDLCFSQCLLLGMLCLTAFLIRPNSIAVWIVYCAAITLHQIWLRQLKKIGKYITGFLLGSGIAILPLIFYLTKNQAWTGFLEFFQFNFKYVQVYEDKIAAAGHFFFTPIAFLALLGIVVSCIKKWMKKQNCLGDVCYLGWYLLSLYFTSMAGMSWNHYGCMMLPVYVAGIALLFQEIKEKLYSVSSAKVSCLTAVFSLLVVIFAAIRDPNGSWSYIKDYEWIVQDSPWHDLEVKEIAELVKQNTDESEKISVFGNACKYYLAAERKSVSKWIYQYPLCEIDPMIGEKYLFDLTEEKPKAIVVSSKEVLEHLKDKTAQKLKQFLEQSYSCRYEGEHAMLFFRNEEG